VRRPLRACPPNAKPIAHLKGGVTFLDSGVAKAALPCKFGCKITPETSSIAVFYKWHANCIMLGQDGGQQHTKPEGTSGGQPWRSDYREVGLSRASEQRP